jgi:hypothetical protein
LNQAKEKGGFRSAQKRSLAQQGQCLRIIHWRASLKSPSGQVDAGASNVGLTRLRKQLLSAGIGTIAIHLEINRTEVAARGGVTEIAPEFERVECLRVVARW